MKKNIIFISFFIVAIIALYFTKIFYSDHSLKKSIQACTIAQIKKSEEITKEDAKKYCENEINQKLNK